LPLEPPGSHCANGTETEKKALEMECQSREISHFLLDFRDVHVFIQNNETASTNNLFIFLLDYLIT
jgi:hypothetical protein